MSKNSRDTRGGAALLVLACAIVLLPAEWAHAQEPPAAGPRLAGPRSLIMGGSVLALGSILGGLWWNERSSMLTRCNFGSSSCSNDDSLRTGLLTAQVTTVSLAVGSLALTTVGALWLRHRKRAHPPRFDLWSSVGPRGLDVGFTNRF